MTDTYAVSQSAWYTTLIHRIGPPIVRWTTRVCLGMSVCSTMLATSVAHGQQMDMNEWMAQTLKARWPKPGSERLTVRPRTMATGTHNPTAGTYPLDPSILASATPPDSSPAVLVTVPPQCVGAHRCPLLVQLPGGGFDAQLVTDWLKPAAYRYGYLVLTSATYTPAFIDAALHETLRRFAVDPTKIAVLGRCASGWAGLRFGIDNPDVFSLVGASSFDGPLFDGIDSHNTTTKFVVNDALNETDDTMFTAIAEVRRAGHPIQLLTSIRTHEMQLEDEDDVGQWLHDNWAHPGVPSAPRTVPAPQPVLTLHALTQLTTFWTRFFQEPDSIRMTARMAYDRQTVVPLGKTESWTYMVDMPTFAAHMPAVAADLKAAGLTAAQHDAYRLAMLSALIMVHAPKTLAALDPQSVVAQNVAFLQAYPDEVKALAWAGIQKQEGMWESGGLVGGWSQWTGRPEGQRAVGPMGIWRTP